MARPCGQFAPVLRCFGSALPAYRFVQVNGSNQGSFSAANGVDVIGVSDGSNILFDDADHANVGDAIRLQVGDIKRVEVLTGDTITAGERVSSGANGFASTSATGDPYFGIALQTAGGNDFVDIIWMSGITP